jgi:hypothetical protein
MIRPTARQSEPLRTSSSISDAKAKKNTLRHPMDNSHVADPQPSALYYTNANSLDRQNDQIEAYNVRGANTADERHWRVDSSM